MDLYLLLKVANAAFIFIDKRFNVESKIPIYIVKAYINTQGHIDDSFCKKKRIRS